MLSSHRTRMRGWSGRDLKWLSKLQVASLRFESDFEEEGDWSFVSVALDFSNCGGWKVKSLDFK